MLLLKLNIKVSKQPCRLEYSNIPLFESESGNGRTSATDLWGLQKLNASLLLQPVCELKRSWESLLIQLHRLFHLGSNQILWKDFGFSCGSHWRLLTASYPEFPQTAAGWRRVIQARFAIRPLTPPLQTLPRTAHDPPLSRVEDSMSALGGMNKSLIEFCKIIWFALRPQKELSESALKIFRKVLSYYLLYLLYPHLGCRGLMEPVPAVMGPEDKIVSWSSIFGSSELLN